MTRRELLENRASSMNRRDVLSLLGGGAVSWPVAVRAQQSALPVVGFLSGRSPTDSVATVAAFNRGLNEVSFFDGQNSSMEEAGRHPGGCLLGMGPGINYDRQRSQYSNGARANMLKKRLGHRFRISRQ
jgi:hypothetical protein